MKKFVALILSVTLLIAFSPVLRANASSSEEALKVLSAIKPRIPDTSQYEEFDSSSHRDGDTVVFNFNWSSSTDGLFKSMYVSATSGGIITGYGIHEDKSTPAANAGFDRISKDEAMKKALELVKKLNPTLGDRLSLKSDSSIESFDDNGFVFSIIHTENGIPVFGDSGRVRVDINAEKITSFSLSFTEGLTYPSPIKIVDLATAKAAFTDSIGLDLYYRVYTNSSDKTLKIYPVYAPKADNVYINALTGKAEKVIPYTESFFVKNESAMDSVAGGGADTGLSEAELKEIANLRKLISRADAEELVRSNKILGLDDGCTLEEYSTRKLSATEDLYGHTLVFRGTVDEKANYIYIDMNAETGEILSFSNFGSATDTNEDTSSSFKDMADLVLTELAPAKSAEYQLYDEADNGLYFVYKRLANRIPVEGNTASIEFNPDGSLASYRIRYTNAEFPGIDDIATNAQVCEKFFDYTKYSLRYIPQKSDPELKKPDVAVLIYAPETTDIYIDAYTQNRINYDGTAYTEPVPESYTDISEHYAREQIAALRRFGIGFENAEFLPDNVILQKDFITLLAGAFGGASRVMISADTKADDYYLTAKRLGLITDAEIAPQAQVTRLQAAKFVCRALKVEQYAKLDHIFLCPFKDVTSDKGYVTLLYGLGILKGTGPEKYSPDSPLTRAQAAVVIYNAMENK